MKITYSTTYNNYKINNNKSQGCYIEVLDKIDNHIGDMLEKHSKIFTTRFDLRTSTDENASSLDSPKIEHFIENLTKDLSRNNPLPKEGKKKAANRNLSKHKVDPRVIVVSEQHDAEKNHVHGLIIANGNAKRDSWDILQRVERQYKNVLKDEYKPGLVDYCNKNGPNSYLIKGKEDEKLNDLYRQSSYLAKVRGKDDREKGAWLVRGTRTPKK